jgi:hypothetical protein
MGYTKLKKRQIGNYWKEERAWSSKTGKWKLRLAGGIASFFLKRELIETGKILKLNLVRIEEN